MEQLIQVMTAVESREDGEKIARALLEERLAACIQITSPVTSIYRWKGNVETADEMLLFIKTRKNYFSRVEQTIKKNHPYETPEIISTEVSDASASFARWLIEQTEPVS